MVNLKQIEFLDKIFVRRPYFEASAYKVGKLRDVLKTNVFKNAIWLASTEFFNELQKKDFDYDLLNAKERLTALKFYNRMSFRGTPFGAFSTFGLVNWDYDGTKQEGKGQENLLHLFPSVKQELIERRSGSLAGNPFIAVNPTLYQLNSGWRYSRYEEDKQGKLSFSVYLLQYDPADELLLTFLNEKLLPLDDVITYLVELADCTREESSEHIVRLINEQVLISSHALSLIIDQSNVRHWQFQLNNDLELFDEHIQANFDMPRAAAGQSFYAGTEMRGGDRLSAQWQADIFEAIKALDLLAPIPPKNNLDKFRDAFELKFGDRSVPLLEALDPDLGVDFEGDQRSEEHNLLKGLVFEEKNKIINQLTWTPVHELLAKCWLQNKKRTEWEPVVLTENDLADLPHNSLPFPPSTSVFCSLAGDKIFFQNIGGASANALIGRFSVFSNDFDTFCKATSKLECDANPDVLFAEIEQVSHRRVDNINKRQQIYEYVIPLNTFPSDRAILPKDINLRLSGDEIILEHGPTAKRVIPRLPTAFNFHHNEMPLFRFLCALQFKSIRANFDFDPKKVFPGLNFYPRIEYGRCIFSLARWQLNNDEITKLVRRPLSISRLHLFCRERGIPAMISLGQGDQQLVFDIANDDEAVFFLETLAGQVNSVITEHIATDNKFTGPNGIFNSEYVVSLHNRDAVYAPLNPKVPDEAAVRDFQPGSEWLYMKIYATYQTMEFLLVEILMPWIDQNKNRIRQWFFVRYYDTGSHLRIRLKSDLSTVKDLQFELQTLINPLLRSGLVQKAYFDTYQREIERYSARLIEDVEHVFFRGSEVVAAKLGLKMTEDITHSLWPIVHCYQIIFTFFAGDLDKINQLCAWAAKAFFSEQGAGKELKRSMDDRYRELRPNLINAIDEDYDDDSLTEFNSSITRLSDQAGAFNELTRQKLIADIVHMQINRIFESDQRKYETFIWHCLSKIVVTKLKKEVRFKPAIIDDH